MKPILHRIRTPLIYFLGILFIAVVLLRFWDNSERIYGWRDEDLLTVGEGWIQPVEDPLNIGMDLTVEDGAPLVIHSEAGVSILDPYEEQVIADYDVGPSAIAFVDLEQDIDDGCNASNQDSDLCLNNLNDLVEILIFHPADGGTVDVIRNGEHSLLATGLGMGTPAAIGYVPFEDEPSIAVADREGRVRVISLAGATLWEWSLPAAQEPAAAGGPYTGSLSLGYIYDYHGFLLVVISEDGIIYALNRAGDAVWSIRQEDMMEAVVAGNRIWVASQHYVSIFDLQGKLWQKLYFEEPLSWLRWIIREEAYGEDREGYMVAAGQKGALWILTEDGRIVGDAHFLHPVTSITHVSIEMSSSSSGGSYHPMFIAGDEAGNLHFIHETRYYYGGADLAAVEMETRETLPVHGRAITAIAAEPEELRYRGTGSVVVMDAGSITWYDFRFRPDEQRTIRARNATAGLGIVLLLLLVAFERLGALVARRRRPPPS